MLIIEIALGIVLGYFLLALIGALDDGGDDGCGCGCLVLIAIAAFFAFCA